MWFFPTDINKSIIPPYEIQWEFIFYLDFFYKETNVSEELIHTKEMAVFFEIAINIGIFPYKFWYVNF